MNLGIIMTKHIPWIILVKFKSEALLIAGVWNRLIVATVCNIRP